MTTDLHLVLVLNIIPKFPIHRVQAKLGYCLESSISNLFAFVLDIEEGLDVVLEEGSACVRKMLQKHSKAKHTCVQLSL